MVYEGGSASDTFKVVGSNDSSIGVSAVSTKCWDKQYLELNLYCPEDETMPDGSTCSYTANDMSVGDLDGDGVLELIVKWYPSNAKDNSGSGYTGKTFLDGYDINYATGKVSLLWRIDMGVNIRSGAHYTQFQVWDYDCDGKAVTPYIITNNLWDIQGVKQYRFIQEDVQDYTIWLNGDPEKMDQEEILRRIRPYLGEEARIKIEMVDEIPVLASGKRKYIENRCEKYQQHKGFCG